MKLATTFQLTLPPRRREEPAYRWLYAALQAEILSSRLCAGTRLPSTRDLARQYGLARGTVVNAFEQLQSEGYVEGSVGSGTRVSKILPEGLLQVAPAGTAKGAAHSNCKTVLSDYGRRAKLFSGYESRPTCAFRSNLPALDLFPMALWTKITVRCLRRISTRHLMGCDPLGYIPLRQAVAEYLNRSRGVRCVPQQVAIVSGVQEAVDLMSRVSLDPGDRVCMENPGYTGAAMVFEALGARIRPIGIDQEGIRVAQLPTRGVRLIYVTPGHQFPLGTTMSLARRLQLLQWARKSGAMIFEDDYDSEYRYAGRPIPALQGLDSRGSVVYMGSFSKVLFPALRLGYVVVPLGLLDQVEAALSLTSRHAPILEQLVVSDFITEGHFGRHLRRMRQIYAERLSVLLDEGRSRLAGLLEISNVEAGLQTVAWLRSGIDPESAAAAAAKRNVLVTPLGRYNQPSGDPQGLQLGFAALDAKEIRRGVRDLAIALEETARSAR